MPVVSRALFGLISIALMLMAIGLIVFGAGTALLDTAMPVRLRLLDAVGYMVISVAVFEVGKYILEEEVMREREMLRVAEARRSLTKFISTIIIIVFLEAIVTIFRAVSEPGAALIYPTALLATGVLVLLGLGVFQHLSTYAEKRADEPSEPGLDAS